MTEQQRVYRDGDTIYILMDGYAARGVMEEWMDRNYACDLVIHRSRKHKGMVVIETKDVMWSARIIQWHKCEQVTYKKQ
jgi:hypothetical protein